MTQWILLAQAQQQPSILVSMMPMLLIFLVFYFIWFMPIRKKQKALEELLKNLAKGDRVVTTGGFYGQVIKAEDHTVVLRLAPENVVVKVAKRAIAGLEGSPAEKGDH